MTTTQPILTIGLPVYNGEEFLSAALDGILGQSFGNFILRVSDNCSTDATPEILRAYAVRDPRMQVVRQPQNLGVPGNFRYLFDRCTTPYFTWAAADDLLSPDWFEKLMPIATATPCLAFGTIQMMDAAGNTLRHPADRRNFSFTGSRMWRRLQYFLMPNLYGKANPIYAVFPKASFGPEVWQVFEGNAHAGDVAALHVLLGKMPLISRTDAFLFKRRHSGNLASQSVDGKKRRKPPFRHTMIPLFWRQSNGAERVLLVLTYPLAALGAVVAKITYLRLRMNARSPKVVTPR